MVPGSHASIAPFALRAVALHAYAHLCRVPGSGNAQTIGSSYAYATYEHASFACAAVHSAETFACRWLPLPGPGSATGFHVLPPVCVCFILLVKPRPTVPKYPGGIGAGGNGGSGGIVEQKSTTNQTGDYNSGKTYRLHLLLVLPSDGNRALRAWS